MGREDETTSDDAYKFKDMDGPWLPCLPSFMNMPFFTLVFAMLGIIVGALLADTDIHERGKTCYKSDTGKTQYYTSTDNALQRVNNTFAETFYPNADLLDGTFKGGSMADPAETIAGSRTVAPGMMSCWIKLFKWPGVLWIRALKCLVSPLLACMMLLLPSKLGDLGGVGMRVAGLLLFTSTFAAIEGLVWVNIIQPGRSISADDVELAGSKTVGSYVSWLESIMGVVQNAIPINIVDEMANLRVLGIITFFLVFGYYLRYDCPKAWSDPILNSGRGFLRCTMNFLRVVMWWTPIAMFSLVSYNLMNIDKLDKVFNAVGLYVLTQLLGQFVHLLGFYFIFYFLTTRRNPLAFFMQIYEAPMTALATSSSAATLPVTLRVNLAEKDESDNKGRAVCNFVIPLGAAINMDGTSLGFPVMVVFVAQIGQELGYMGAMSAGDMIVVALLSMVCSLGTAPIPNAGLVYLTMLLESGNVKNEALQGLGIALITLFDWLVDRVETAQNVTSDSFISKIISTMKFADTVEAQAAELVPTGQVQAKSGDLL